MKTGPSTATGSDRVGYGVPGEDDVTRSARTVRVAQEPGRCRRNESREPATPTQPVSSTTGTEVTPVRVPDPRHPCTPCQTATAVWVVVGRRWTSGWSWTGPWVGERSWTATRGLPSWPLPRLSVEVGEDRHAETPGPKDGFGAKGRDILPDCRHGLQVPCCLSPHECTARVPLSSGPSALDDDKQ